MSALCPDNLAEILQFQYEPNDCVFIAQTAQTKRVCWCRVAPPVVDSGRAGSQRGGSGDIIGAIQPEGGNQ